MVISSELPCGDSAFWLSLCRTNLQSLCYPSLQPLLPPRLPCHHTPHTLANTGLSKKSQKAAASIQAQRCLVVFPAHLFPILPASSLLQVFMPSKSLMVTGQDFCSTSAPCWPRHLHCSCTSKAPSLSTWLFRSWFCPATRQHLQAPSSFCTV